MQQRINVGEIDYDALLIGLERRWADNYRFRVSYTLGKSRGNTSGNGIPISNFQFLDDMNLDQNEGPTDVDRRHNLVLSGSAIVPGTGGLTVGTVARYLSGTAFTVHDTNTDPDRNGILIDPLPAGTYSGSGADAITVDNAGGRNGAYGPSFFQWDMRLGYQIRIRETSRIELFGECFNLTNRANFDNPTGDRRSHQLPGGDGAASGRRAADVPARRARGLLKSAGVANAIRYPRIGHRDLPSAKSQRVRSYWTVTVAVMRSVPFSAEGPKFATQTR